MTQKNRLRPPEVAEIVFDIAYLVFALGAGICFLLHAGGRAEVLLCGALALTLAGGDAFHLVPRVRGLLSGTMAQSYRALGFGKLVTSVTMTVFYVLLCYLWRLLYGFPAELALAAAWGLAAVRIVLCLMPQNGWMTQEPPARWAVARNVPFLLLGALVMGLYAYSSIALGTQAGGFRLLWLAILLSFGFYVPVVVFAGRFPAFGALMLPKTCAYVWMLCMGFSLL